MSVEVTKLSYPYVHEAFENVSHDSGGGAGHESYAVPDGLQRSLDAAERTLAELSDDDRVTVAVGDQDEAEQILADFGEDGVHTHRLLDAFFNDWVEDDH